MSRARRVGAGRDGRRHHQCGISLLEMLAALALLALMLAMLPGIFDLGRKALSAKPRIEAAETIAVANTALAQWLGAARPAERRLPGGGRVVAFDGAASAVTFIAPAPDALATGGLVTLTLTLVPSRTDGRRDLAIILGDGPSLDGAADGGSDGGRRSVLIEGVERLSLRYFGAAPTGEAGKRWQETWTERQLLPELVEVSYETTSGTRQTVVAATKLGRRT